MTLLRLSMGCLIWICSGMPLLAHTLDEVKQALPDKTESIPHDLLDMTQLLNSTVGTNSVRDSVHAKQHRLLLDHVRAQITRKCGELAASLPSLDQDIVRLRERGEPQEEQTLRDIRDIAEAFLAENCHAADKAPGKP